MKTKHCKHCNKDLPLSEFKKLTKAPDGLQYRCSPCATAYSRKHYLANRDRYLENTQRNRLKTLAWYREYKKGISCKVCGEDRPPTLDHHHRDATTKLFTVSMAVNEQSIKRIKEEIAKCDVLCSNCHRMHHNMLS